MRSAMKILLPEAKQKKITFLSILTRCNCEIDELTEKLGMTRRTIHHYIRELNNDLATYFGVDKMINSTNYGLYSINPQYRDNIDEYYMRLKLNYLKEEPDFVLLSHLATEGFVITSQAAKILNVSPSYLSRIIKRNNERLAPYKVKIESKNKNLILAGPEIPVRMFLFYLISQSYQLIEWPFKAIDKNQILEQLYNKDEGKHKNYYSDEKQNQLCIIVALIKIRISKGFLLSPCTGDQKELLKFLLTKDSFVEVFRDNFKILKKMNSEVVECEILICNLMMRVLVGGFSTRENRLELGKKFMNEKFESTLFAKKLIRNLIRELNLHINQSQLYLFKFYITVLYLLQQLKGDVDELQELFEYEMIEKSMVDEQMMHKIEKVFKLVAAEFNVEYMVSNQSIYYLITKFLYELIQLSIVPRVHIYLQIVGDYIGEAFIYERLYSIYNKETIVITADYSEADLVICNTHNNSKENKKPTFYFNSIYDFQQWASLVELIWKMILAMTK